MTYLPSFQPNVAYVLLQLKAPKRFREEPDYRGKRQGLLEIICGAAKNKFPNLVKVIGIGIDAPKYSDGTNAEDFILTRCDDWPEDQRAFYEAENEPRNFFGTPHLKQHNGRITQFVQPPTAPSPSVRPTKVGRNDPCPCGSGVKFKKCCGGSSRYEIV